MAAFEVPATSVSVRMIGCRTTNRRPSAISVRTVVGSPVADTARAARNRPRTPTSSSAPARYSRPGAPRAQPAPRATSGPANGAPRKELATCSVVSRRPFAASSRSFGTSAGTIAWAQVSWKTSQVPSTRASAHSSGTDSDPVATTATPAASATTRTRLVTSITLRRSYRSATTPANSVVSSHGSVAEAETSETCSGERVIPTASRAAAVISTPSARFTTPRWAHIRWNVVPVHGSSC